MQGPDLEEPNPTALVSGWDSKAEKVSPKVCPWPLKIWVCLQVECKDESSLIVGWGLSGPSVFVKNMDYWCNFHPRPWADYGLQWEWAK
jgi:hypothetical protein